MVEVVAVIIALPVLSLIFGVLILLFPKLLNYLIGVYLVITGLLGIIGAL